MSYNKMMKRADGHRHDKDFQPIFAMLFKENEYVESYYSIAKRTADGFHVRVRNNINEEFKVVSKNFDTEDDAVDFCRENDLDNKYAWVRIYSDKGMHVRGW